MENICHAPFPCKEDKPCQSKIYITCACQAQKQEMKCGASKYNEGNGGKTLPCNDECARLERNRKLALALNIDQSTHVDGGDHIPYSADTLNIFAEHIKWAQTQEREFRVFASSPEEKRLRFKPMQPQQRAFIHALADDFGLDSESMDPEPHRHVMIWKTPRFVSAPNKTLTEALRIRQLAQRSTTASANVSDNEGSKKVSSVKRLSSEPFNAFVIGNPKFGLTIDELRSEISAQLHPGMSLTFDIDFQPSEEVVLKAISQSLSGFDLQQLLQSIKTQLVSAMVSKGYGSPELCATDSSLNILRRESDSGGGDGWSKVAAKKAAPRIAVSSDGVRGNNLFAALGDGKVTFAKKKPAEKIAKSRKEVVVDDWEAAELAEEERERGVSGGSEDESPAAPAQGDEKKGGVPAVEAQVDENLQHSVLVELNEQPSNWAEQVEEGGS
jgi:transcriptional repressor NF-X1